MSTRTRLAAIGAVLAVAAGGPAFAGEDDHCDDAQPFTVYTDDLMTYVGLCGERNGYVQVNDVQGAVDGQHALVEARTGVQDVDKALNNGPARVWVRGQADEGSCGPEGDTTLLHNDGSHVNRALPTVYTDNGATHAGVCTDEARIQVNDVAGALAGEHPLVEVEPLP